MVIRLIFAVAFLLLAIAVVLFYLQFGITGNLLEIRLDSLRGLNFVSYASEVWNILAVCLVINIINAFLASSLLKRGQTFVWLLPAATLLVDLLILIYISVIVSIN
ncbi:MAG: hypothetical protein Q8L24_01035 [bacterium]|nr:hypothetical protein [bacterium]